MEIAATKISITCGLRIADSWLGVKMKISWRFSKQRQLVTLLTIALAGTWQQVATQKKRFNEKCVVLESMGKPITSKRNCSNYLLGSGDLHGWHEIDSACGCSLSWFRISSHLRSLMEHWWQLNLHLLRASAFFHNGSYVAPNWFSKRFAGWRLPILPRFSTHLRHSEKASWVSVATFRVESLLQTFWQNFHVANFKCFFSVWLVSDLVNLKFNNFYCDVCIMFILEK